jgi:hypothetical protein
MPSTFSPNLRIELIPSGDQTGTWGTTTNNNLGTLIESAISGYVSVSITSADQALTASDGVADQSRNMVINLTTTTTAPFNVYVPPAEKLYVIRNSSAYAATIYCSTSLNNTIAAGAGVTVPANRTTFIFTDATDVVIAANFFPAMNLASALSVANGGTGATSLTNGAILKGSGTSAVTTATAGTDYLAPPSGTAIVKANSGGALANAVAGTDYLAPPSGTAIVKANSGGALANATAGTDYLAPPSGTALLKANSGGALANAVAGTDYVSPTGSETLTNKTLDGPIINNGYTEEVFAVTGTTPALSPTNGSIQTWTLSGNSTPTAGTWASGQSILLMIDDGTAYTVTWSSLSVTWKTGGGTAPTLLTSGYTPIVLWKVDSTIYGAQVGNA